MSQRETYKSVKLHHQRYIPNHCDHSLPPIVLLHGIGDVHSSWNTVLPGIANATSRTAFSIDLRNHGKSEWSDCFTLEVLVADFENFLAENGINKCIIIAHSLGGKVAMYFTLTKPSFVEKIILEEVKLSDHSDEDVNRAVALMSQAKRMSILPRGMSELEVRQYVLRLAKEKYPNEPFMDTVFYVPLRRNPNGSFSPDFNIDVVVKHVQDRSAIEIDFSKCQKFDGPALFLHGNSTYMKVEEDSNIKEFFPEAQYYKFKKAAHSLHVTFPAEYIEKVSSFIKGS